MAPEEKLKIVIDNEEEDDWMKSLPGYMDEIEIHERAEAKLDDESDKS